MKMRYLVLVVVIGLLGSAAAEADSPSCSAADEWLVQWPKAPAEPVWEMCTVRPSASSGARGSGLELREVHYLGKLVFKRAHAPILNVDYAPLGTSQGTCFRDWLYAEKAFAVSNQVFPGMWEPTEPAETVCDNATDPFQPVGDCPWSGETCGTGIAAEYYNDRLVLTSHANAGWYRYSLRWVFYSDGTIEPEFGFGTYNTTMSDTSHNHHVYWRFDFDIAGADGDVVSDGSTTFTTETAVTQWSTPSPVWSISDTATGLGYELEPGTQELRLDADGFSHVNFMVSQYRASEIDDGGGQCEINHGAIVNAESLVDQDVVLWYRGGVTDTVNQDIFLCKKARPTLRPTGDWGETANIFIDDFESGNTTAWQ